MEFKQSMKNSTAFFARDIVSAIKNNKIDPSSEIVAEKTPQVFAEFIMSIPDMGICRYFVVKQRCSRTVARGYKVKALPLISGLLPHPPSILLYIGKGIESVAQTYICGTDLRCSLASFFLKY